MDDSIARAPRELLVKPGGMDLHVSDMTATFAADVTLGSALDWLAEVGQWLPVDGDLDGAIGELVEWNSTGPLRLGFGAWRDLMLGVQFRNGRGELITAGGRTVKNVAGYDLTKFMVGSRGVFGKVMTVTVRTYRRPEGALVARFRGEGMTIGQLLPAPYRPQWAVVNAEGLWCGYVGDTATLEYYQRELRKRGDAVIEALGLAEEIKRRGRIWRATGAWTFRAAVPPARAAEFGNASGASRWVADAAFGIVIGEVTSDDHARSLRAAAGRVNGTITFIDRRDPMHPRYDVSTSPPERRIIERLKQAFDPDHRLQPLPWNTH